MIFQEYKYSMVALAVFGGPFLFVVGAVCTVVSIAMLWIGLEDRTSAFGLLAISLVSVAAGGVISIWAFKRTRGSEPKIEPAKLDIAVDDRQLTVGGERIIIDRTRVSRMKALLGRPDLSHEGSAPWDQYTHHDCGIVYGQDPSTRSLNFIDLHLTLEAPVPGIRTFDPDESFPGTFHIHGIPITAETTRSQIEQAGIPTMDLDETSDFFIVFGDCRTVFLLSPEGGVINRVRIVSP